MQCSGNSSELVIGAPHVERARGPGCGTSFGGPQIGLGQPPSHSAGQGTGIASWDPDADPGGDRFGQAGDVRDHHGAPAGQRLEQGQ